MGSVQREALARLRRAAAGSRQDRLLRGLRAWGEAAAETGSRQQLVQGAVQQHLQYAGLAGIAPLSADWWTMIETAARLARSWQSWTQRHRRRPAAAGHRAPQLDPAGRLTTDYLARESERITMMRDEALKNGDVATAMALGASRRALQRLRWPGVTAALRGWGRGARAAARERVVLQRVGAALLHRHAAPALHTWAHGCRRRGARRAAAHAADRSLSLGRTARALLTWQAAGVRVLQLTLLRHSASLALRGFGRAAALRQWGRHAARAKLLASRRADATRYASALAPTPTPTLTLTPSPQLSPSPSPWP